MRKKNKLDDITYLQGLTNAEDDTEATVNGGLDLTGNELFQKSVHFDHFPLPRIANATDVPRPTPSG